MQSTLGALFLTLLLAPSQGLATLECGKIRADSYTFDLSKLGGPHSVVTSKLNYAADTHVNTTYTVDICKPLKKSGKKSPTEECPNGTRVCAIRRLIGKGGDMIEDIISIAGNLKDHGGGDLDEKPTRLKTSEGNDDSYKEGLRLVLKGGKHPLKESAGNRRPQKTVIEFLCDKDKEGTEGEWESEDKYEKRADDKDDKGEDRDGVEHQLKKDDAALIWKSYNVFLGIAAYLIFGSWINHTRYGARGWDLLPHGDTIRDIPY
ncbi:hypothetical protein Golomagni_07706, partial [Golovinomyces magnicellulatus]